MNRPLHEIAHAAAIQATNAGDFNAADYMFAGAYKQAPKEVDPIWLARVKRDHARNVWQGQLAVSGQITDHSRASELLEESKELIQGFTGVNDSIPEAIRRKYDELAATTMFQGRLHAANARHRRGAGFDGDILVYYAIPHFRNAARLMEHGDNQWYRYGTNIRGQLTAMLAKEHGAADVFGKEADKAVAVEPEVIEVNAGLTRARKFGIPALKFAHPLAKNMVAKRILN